MKILIIGGTSFIGLYTTRLMEKQGHCVSVFHRNKSNIIDNLNISHIYGDKDSVDDLRQAIDIAKPEVIVDMMAMTEMDIKTLEKALNQKTRIVVISSADVYNGYNILTFDSKEEVEMTPFLETSSLRNKLFPYRGKYDFPFANEYEKILVETAALSSSKMDSIILRLGMVYGPFDNNHRFASHIKDMSMSNNVILTKEQANWYSSMVYVENVAHAILLATMSEKKGAIYNVAEKHSLSILEWVQEIAKIVGFKGAICVESSSEPCPLNYLQNFTLNTDKIRNELLYEEIVSFENGLIKTLDWECSQIQ